MPDFMNGCRLPMRSFALIFLLGAAVDVAAVGDDEEENN